MRTTRNLILLALLLAVAGCSLAGNSEAVSIQTVEPGVQQVTPLVDRNTFLPSDNATAPWYRIYDDQTGQWYPAKKNAAGEWELTKKGMAMRADDLEALAEPDEDKVTQWRNDTRGFAFTPELTATNATGQGMKARPAPQLDLERKRDTDILGNGAAADSAKMETAQFRPLETTEAPGQAEVEPQGTTRNAVLTDDEPQETTEEPAMVYIEPAAAADEPAQANIQPQETAEAAVWPDEEPETVQPAIAGEVLEDSREMAATAPTTEDDAVVDVDYGVREPAAQQERKIPPGASNMRLEGRAPTWVTAVVDGSDKRDFYIRNGQAVDFYFGSSVVLEVGHVPSVQVFLDGEPYSLEPDGVTTIRRP